MTIDADNMADNKIYALLLSALISCQVPCFKINQVGLYGESNRYTYVGMAASLCWNTGIVTLGYRYNSTKAPVSLVRHGRDKIFPRPW